MIHINDTVVEQGMKNIARTLLSLKMTPEGGTGVFEPEDIYNLTPSFSFSSSWKTPKMLILEEEKLFPVPYGLDPRLSIPLLCEYRRLL